MLHNVHKHRETLLAAVPSPETVRAMSIVRLSRMLAVFVTLASVSSRATLSSEGLSVTSTKTVLASKLSSSQIFII